MNSQNLDLFEFFHFPGAGWLWPLIVRKGIIRFATDVFHISVVSFYYKEILQSVETNAATPS